MTGKRDILGRSLQNGIFHLGSAVFPAFCPDISISFAAIKPGEQLFFIPGKYLHLCGTGPSRNAIAKTKKFAWISFVTGQVGVRFFTRSLRQQYASRLAGAVSLRRQT